MRVAYTLEQCWHRVPGGTGVAALRVAHAMAAHPEVELIGVAGRHTQSPPEPWVPPIDVRHLPVAAPWLYETWLRLGWPKVERATGAVDIAHATTLIPCAASAPVVVTLHDLAFLHEPQHFTPHGVRVFQRSLSLIRRNARLVLCCSQATMDDAVAAGVPSDRLRLVPLGVDAERADAASVERVRARHSLPER
ncbi:MAG: glycosyltransferase, partial [Actinomycetota bacterium]